MRDEGPLNDPPFWWEEGEQVFVLPLEQVLWDADRQVRRVVESRERLRRAWLLVLFFGCMEAGVLIWILYLGHEYLTRLGR